MTRREMFTEIANGNITEEIKEMALAEIAKMDARNAKRSATPSKTAIANEPIKEAIANVLGYEPMTAKEIAEGVGISVQKASALLRQIEGLNVTEVKVKGKGKVKGYSVA